MPTATGGGAGPILGSAKPGDVLILYAVCAPLLIAMRNLPTRRLIVLATATLIISPVVAAFMQPTIHADGWGLGEYWGVAGTMSDAVGLWLLSDFFLRALGIMMIGVVVYRTGFLTGDKTDSFYRRTALWGLGLGLPLCAAGFGFVAVNDFEPGVALTGTIPNTAATIPAAMGYAGLIMLWHHRTPERAANKRIRAVGRMALTNYLSQTVLGIGILNGLLDPSDLNRGLLALFVACVWTLQLWWSQAWLKKHCYGPAEWAWRAATYCRLPTWRHSTAV